MIHEVEITTAPSVEPLTTAEFHSWANMPTAFTDDDTIIANVIKSARQMVERYLNRALITQTLTVWWEVIPTVVYLPFAPIQSVTTVKTKRLNVSTTLTENTNFYVQGNKDKYLRMTDPFHGSVAVSEADKVVGYELEVVYVAGYGDASTDIPQDIIDAVQMVAVGNYTSRVGENEKNLINEQVKEKLNPYRVYTI